MKKAVSCTFSNPIQFQMTTWQQVVNNIGGFSASEKATFIRIMSAMPENRKRDIADALNSPGMQPDIIESISQPASGAETGLQDSNAGEIQISKEVAVRHCFVCSCNRESDPLGRVLGSV
jgi:hypothetical protein